MSVRMLAQQGMWGLVLRDLKMARDTSRYLSPFRCGSASLMRIKGSMIDECFVHFPYQWVIRRSYSKYHATRFRQCQGDMRGQILHDNRRLIGVGTDQLTAEADHSHSIVPGGFEVMS